MLFELTKKDIPKLNDGMFVICKIESFGLVRIVEVMVDLPGTTFESTDVTTFYTGEHGHELCEWIEEWYRKNGSDLFQESINDSKFDRGFNEHECA